MRLTFHMQKKSGFSKINCMGVLYARGHSSVVEHSTADREVTGSIPVAPFIFIIFLFNILHDDEMEVHFLKNINSQIIGRLIRLEGASFR